MSTPVSAFGCAARIPFSEIESDIIKIAHHVDPLTGAIGLARGNAVTYAVQVAGDDEPMIRTRDGGSGYGVYRNGSWETLERILSHIEQGGETVAVSTGRAAISLVLAQLPAGSHVIITPNDLYPGTRKLFDALRQTTGLDVTYADSTPEALAAARRPNTRLVFTEPLTNPLLKVADLTAVAAFAKQHGLLSVADNTLTPLLVKPLSYGFDVVIHSLTKYISGHNNTLGGAVIVNKARPDLAQALRATRSLTGATLSPQDAATLIEQAKGFPRRMETHCRNAAKIARWLEKRPEVARVYYPGLPSSPDYALARRQFGAFGGLFSFELKGDIKDVQAFIAPLREIVLADSFGADITLLNWYSRQSTFFSSKTEVERKRFGITETFLRVAVGRGSVDAIIRDFERGFAALAQRSNVVPMTGRPLPPLGLEVAALSA